MRPVFQQLWHGDSVELCAKFKPNTVDCIITDPPFGSDNLSKFATSEHGRKYARKIENDESPELAIEVFTKVMNVLLPKTKEQCDVYVFTSYQVLKEWLVFCDNLFAMYGFERKAVLIWEKEGPGMGDLETWGAHTEFILFFKRGRRMTTDKRRNGVLHYPQIPPGKLLHPHEKPLPLLEAFIRHSTSPGDFIVDPFGGSGSLARATRRTNRSSVCIELNYENHAIANQAYEGTNTGLNFE